ncbi:MAG: DNA-formamidopyrimidine glycosylase [Firmicutes bacterium]|nr:DNA-formamidopyrimidine glycosylase [Bacillota bacterium]
MPEIAEVETVRQTLRKRILRKKIKNVNVLYERMIESDIQAFKKELIGLEFSDILRKGKWLLFEIGDYYLCSHLRMEGKYFIKDSSEEINKHEHVIFTFEDNTDLRYHDTRKFGRMNLVLKKDIDTVEGVRKQGIEPIDETLSKEYLYDNFKKRRLPMKTLLLDQTIISGLGNIYADEVLFAAKINPLKVGSDITLDECQRIVDSSKKIIEEAIKCGGTTIKSYTSSLGVTGRFQQNLMAHKRENEECKNCSTIIKRIVVGGRSTYYCENCQK